ncbi:MAG TPA: thiamine-binding protein [Acidimicrobiales bacterium]|nr:thiamine-binding protein [Acidimicrobiales bacterium]
MTLHAEFTVEPFVDGSPGPHVQAAVDAAVAAGLTVQFGPFGTSMSGDDATVLTAVDAVLRAAMDAGATRVSLQLERG